MVSVDNFNGFLKKKKILNHEIVFLNDKAMLVYVFKQIYGISNSTANLFLWKCGFVSHVRVSDLTKAETKFINYLINQYFLSKINQLRNENKFLVRYQLFENRKGFRHLHGLPVNGQRTHTNSKTSRSLIFHSRVLTVINTFLENGKGAN